MLCEIYKKKINFLHQMIESRIRKPNMLENIKKS